MVAIVSGNSLGLNLTSPRTLGQQDFTGVAGHGRNGDRTYVNIATGNLVVQGLEATVAAHGEDIAALRTYDASGQLTGIASPSVPGTAAGRTFAYEDGNVVKVTDEESRVTTFEYDERGNQLLHRDHAGNVVTRTFDARNQLTKETLWTQPDPDGGGIVPAGPLTTSYVYEEDRNNLLRFVVSADGRVTQHT